MLQTNNVLLRSLTKEDLPQLFIWINDRTQVLWNSPYKPVHEIEHHKWFESSMLRNDLKIFAIEKKLTNQLIGSCQLHNIHPIHRSAELQIRLGNVDERGKGYGTEAVKLLLQFGFIDLNLHRIYLHVKDNNPAAIRIYEKCGFQIEGILRQAAFIDGEYVNLQVMGILQKDFFTG